MDKDLEMSNAIKAMMDQYGKSVFADVKRASALSSDYITDAQLEDEKKLLKKVLSQDVMGFMASWNPKTYPDQRKKAIFKLTENYFAAEPVERVFSWFDYALGVTTEMPKPTAAPAPMPAAAPAPSPSAAGRGKPAPVTAFDKLLDDDYMDNIFLYDNRNQRIEFEKIAMVTHQGQDYAILRPILPTGKLAADEAMVFLFDDSRDEDCLVVVDDDRTASDVFEAYYLKMRAQGVQVV